MDPVFQEQWMNINTSVGPEWAEEMRYTGYSRNTVSIQKLQRKAKKGLKKSMRKDQKGTHRRLVTDLWQQCAHLFHCNRPRQGLRIH